MFKSIKIVFTEIFAGENIDLYLTIILSIIIAVLGILQVTNGDIISAVTLAVLALLATSLLANRRANKVLQDTSTQILSEFKILQEDIRKKGRASDLLLKGYPDLTEYFRSAKRISIAGSTLRGTTSKYYTECVNFLKGGGTLRFIMSEPTPEILSMLVDRSSSIKDVDTMSSMVQNNLALIKSMAEKSARPNLLQVRKKPYLPSYSLIIIENEERVNRVFVRILTFQETTIEHPSLEMNSQTDIAWVQFFCDQFEKLWATSTEEKTRPAKPA